MAKPDQQIEVVGMTPDQEEEAWLLYESCGNMAEVARTLKVRYQAIYHTLNRDPIRLHDVQRVRADAVASRWESVEGRCARTTFTMLNMIDKVLSHIQACEEAGCLTDIPAPKAFPDKDGKVRCMTATEAMMWVIQTRMLDTTAKAGFTSAKISEGMRMIASNGQVGAKATNDAMRDVGALSDGELARMVSELEANGRPLPYGVQQWKLARQAREAGTSS